MSEESSSSLVSTNTFSAGKHFAGNAKDLKRLEVTENALKDNAKIIVTDKGISPQLILGDLPISKAE